MPKTRNVTRSQSNTASASKTTSIRRRNDENEAGYESEKENTGRQGTRSQTRSHRRGVLGAPNPTTAAAEGFTTAPTKSTKARAPLKGKRTEAPPKEKKAPLQDITSQFLPAPESANRGEGYEDPDNGDAASVLETSNNVALVMPPLDNGSTVPLKHAQPASPLPPSSPPSDWVPSPVYRREDAQLKTIMDIAFYQDQEDQWRPDDDVQPISGGQSTPTPNSSHSDPFGFVALERKLKQDREIEAVTAGLHDDIYAEEDYEDLSNILVADTSSPRPVRRLKRVHEEADEDQDTPEDGVEADSSLLAPVLPHPHYSTPPTPHKDKQKRRRLSHEARHVFSPCPSSIESSPSPTKLSARKRSQVYAEVVQDPLDEFNEEVDRSFGADAVVENLSPVKKLHEEVSADVAEANTDSVAKNLRSRSRATAALHSKVGSDHEGKSVKPKTKRVKKPISKSRTTAKKEKAAAASDDDEDHDEVRLCP